MADINQQTEELARIMEQVNREMAYYGQITKTTADQKRDAEIEASTGMKNFTKASGTAADAVGHLASAGMAAGKAMLEGKKGAAAFNESIDGLSKAATAAGVALTLLVPGGAIIKGLVAGFTAVTAATAGMVKASNEMADKIYKSYSGLAKSGAAASDGMTGVFKDAKKLGLSMNELDSFVGLVGENAGDLALFAGSVFEGRQKFAEMGEAMEPYRKQMIAAGMTQEQINEGTMGYLRLQTRLGVAQNMTTAQLAEGARKYLIEQDALSKLTGQSRKEMEDQMEAARSEQRFRAKLEEVRATQGEAAAKRLENANIIISSQSKEMGQAFRDTTTGFLGTEAAMKGNMTTNAALMASTQKLIDGQIDEYEMVTTVGKASKQFAKDMNMSAQLGVLNDFAIDYAQTLKLSTFTEENKAEAMKKIIKDQEDQGLKGGKAADGITEQYAKNIVQQQKLNAKMEQTIFDGIDNALAITNKLGNATDVLATGFEKLGKAVNKLLKIVGLGVEDEPTEAEKKAAEVMKGAQGTVDQAKAEKDKAFEGATFKQKFLGIGLTDEQKKAQDAYNEALRQRAEIQQSLATEEAATSKAAPPAAGKQALPAGVAPSAAGGGRGSVAPPSGSPPTAPTRSLGAPPASAGVPDGQPGPAAPAGQAPGGGNGSLRIGPNADMSGLDSEMTSRLEQFAKASGKAVEVTSAFRSDKKQAELWVRGHILKEPGIHMPAAPKEDQEVNYKGKTYQVKGSGKGSLHGVGNAVDIAGMDNKRGPIDDLLANAGLFRPFIIGDPPHVQMLAEGGIVQPTPGGTPAVIGEGGNAEAVIPLKGNRVPVDFPDEIKQFFQFQSQVDFLKFMKGDTAGKGTYEDVDSVVAASQVKMFAKLESMKTELMAKGWDREILENYGEEGKKSGPKTEEDVIDLQSRFNDDVVAESIKENVEQTRTLIDMISELVREQRNANDISTRILQVSSN